MSELGTAKTVELNMDKKCIADRIREATAGVVEIRRKAEGVSSDMFGTAQTTDAPVKESAHTVNELLNDLMCEIRRADRCIASIKAHI